MKFNKKRQRDIRMVSYHVFQGNTYDILRRLLEEDREAAKYRLIVTSPPYFGHRHYGNDPLEIGQEKTSEEYIDKLARIFAVCRNLLTDDGSLWIVIGDTRRRCGKLMIPHRLAQRLVATGYTFREDIIWYKKNNVSSSSKENFSQAYETILFLSKNEKCFTNLDKIRTVGNEAREGRNRTPPPHMLQYRPHTQSKSKIAEILETVHNARPNTPFKELPTTSEISMAYGYDPEKYCPTCYRKFKRHATRKRIGDHKHYPIFAVCNSNGKNPGNVWEVATKAHFGSEHFAIFPEDLIGRIISFATKNGDWVLDPFIGRGTTGIVCECMTRNFCGIDLYPENVSKTKENIILACKANADVNIKIRDQLEPIAGENITPFAELVNSEPL
jgi:DNA modification methylase